ncbi:hypothetical protein L2D08_17235 [Domibacillus sp. PGB-M46]|uniref:hypothetical protein n=1 Tax=Domibacillus sp. PGB-M46 TaxID=2910255 RepID=UPI001F5ABB17|nr:hypothetical protein [Domibacillus sp. PGB-M46]MCI2256097.1 hypothetical protein [Domibacillus sp. PGB-M46]
MDTDKLVKLKQSLGLIGINAIFKGIKPGLVLPRINLGVPLDQLNVKGTLKNAISAYKLTHRKMTYNTPSG